MRCTPTPPNLAPCASSSKGDSWKGNHPFLASTSPACLPSCFAIVLRCVMLPWLPAHHIACPCAPRTSSTSLLVMSSANIVVCPHLDVHCSPCSLRTNCGVCTCRSCRYSLYSYMMSGKEIMAGRGMVCGRRVKADAGRSAGHHLAYLSSPYVSQLSSGGRHPCSHALEHSCFCFITTLVNGTRAPGAATWSLCKFMGL